jgi:hypothetical protein
VWRPVRARVENPSGHDEQEERHARQRVGEFTIEL